MKLVEIADLPSVLSGNQLTFLLPGHLDTIQAIGFYFQKSSDTTYTWWGEISGHKGYVGVASNEYGKLVQISVEDENYIFHPLSERYNAQVKLIPDSFSVLEPELETPPDITFDSSCEMDDCKAIAAILVLVTPEAADEILGRYHVSIQGVFAPIYLALGLQTLNFALLNSGITGKTARFVVEEFDDFEYDPFNLITNDLDNLIVDIAAGDRFTANRADMLILLTDSRYGGYSGAASTLFPVAIVAANYMWGPTFTFAHEVGHLVGARHNRISNGGDVADANACNYGYRFLLGGVETLPRHTIMAVMNEQGGQRILAYSNPRIRMADTPIGTADSDNTGHISEIFCEVAEAVHSDDELKVEIDGPLSIICPQSATYTVDIDPPGTGIPGNAPYSISWAMGESPYTNLSQFGATFLGSSSSISINSGNINYTNFWLFVQVLSSDGVFANDLIEVEVDPCAFFITSSQADISKDLPFLRVFPNPTDDYLIVLNTGSEINIQANYSIVNALGQTLSTGSLTLAGNDQQSEIRFALDAGLYTLQVQTESSFVSYKFMVQR